MRCIDRREWLLQELEAHADYVARHGDDPDPVLRAHADWRRREADGRAAELADDLIGRCVTVRYRGTHATTTIRSPIVDLSADGLAVELEAQPDHLYPIRSISHVEEHLVTAPTATPHSRDRCDGLVVGADGQRWHLREPVTASDAAHALRTAAVTSTPVQWPPGAPPGPAIIHVPIDTGRGPLNWYATQLTGRTRHRIRGDVVVAGEDPARLLPVDLVEHLLGDRVSTRPPRRRTLEWIRHDLSTARALQNTYRSRPEPVDELVDAMRYDSERDIVRLVAELEAAGPSTSATIVTEWRQAGPSAGSIGGTGLGR